MPKVTSHSTVRLKG